MSGRCDINLTGAQSEIAPAQKALGKGPFGAGGFGQSVERGAIPIIYAATSDAMSGAVQSGRFEGTTRVSARMEDTCIPASMTCVTSGWGCLNICSRKLLAAARGHQTSPFLRDRDCCLSTAGMGGDVGHIVGPWYSNLGSVTPPGFAALAQVGELVLPMTSFRLVTVF